MSWPQAETSCYAIHMTLSTTPIRRAVANYRTVEEEQSGTMINDCDDWDRILEKGSLLWLKPFDPLQ